MNHPRFIFVATAAALALMSPPIAFAESSKSQTPSATQHSPASTTYAPLPQANEKNGIRYVVGGVGEQSHDAMRQMAPQYNTHLVFAAEPDDHFVADVGIKVTDANGKTRFQLEPAGPMLFAQLPPGTYDVVATYRGNEKARRIDVGETSVDERFSW